MMIRKTLCGCVAGLLVALVATGASADKYDLQLKRLWQQDPQTGEWRLRGENHFRELIGDVGAALSPRFLGPAATLGSLGFQLAMDYTLTNIPENSDHWKTVMTDHNQSQSAQEGADSYLQTVTLHVRKGLPFSTEVGGTFTKLIESSMWGVGLELKVSPLEGFQSFPELSFGGNISTFLGTRDYALLTTGANALLSKKIGVVGLFKLAPYIGYNFVYVHGSSNVIPVDVKVNKANEAEVVQQVFTAANVFQHFAVFGFQTVATVVDFGFEAGVTSGLQTYSMRMGFEF